MPKVTVLHRRAGKPRPADEGPTTEAVDLSLCLLERLASSRESIGVSELAREFASSKATVYRHLKTLVRHGFVHQESRTLRYAAGIKLFILGERLRERFGILAVAREDMARLREETGQPVTLSTLVENQVVVLEVLQGQAIVNFGTQPGTVLDLHASAHGNIALAFGPEGLMEHCLARPLKAWTLHTICSPSALQRAVAQVRARGWAIAPNRVLQGVNGLGRSTLQSRRRLCRCGRHCRLHPIHPRIASSRADQSGDASGGADIPQARMDQEMNTHEQWQLTAEAAELYERYPARYILGPWAPLLVDAARLAAGERVLDVACGTGVVARVAAQRVGPTGYVIGVDLNPGMIAVARSLPAPIGAPIEWLERSALDLRFGDTRFDAVLCQQGLQFFPDKAVALQQMRRVLDHGGRLALSVWNSAGLYNSAVSEVLARFIGNEIAVRFNASRQAPAKEALHRLAIDAGFSDVEVRVSRINVHLPRLDQFTLDHLAATPVAPVIAAADFEVRQQIGASVMQQLQRFTDGDGVTYPEETHVLTARVP